MQTLLTGSSLVMRTQKMPFFCGTMADCEFGEPHVPITHAYSNIIIYILLYIYNTMNEAGERSERKRMPGGVR